MGKHSRVWRVNRSSEPLPLSAPHLAGQVNGGEATLASALFTRDVSLSALLLLREQLGSHLPLSFGTKTAPLPIQAANRKLAHGPAFSARSISAQLFRLQASGSGLSWHREWGLALRFWFASSYIGSFNGGRNRPQNDFPALCSISQPYVIYPSGSLQRMH